MAGLSTAALAQPAARPQEKDTRAQQRLERIQEQIKEHKTRQQVLEKESKTLAAQAEKIRQNIIDLARLMRAHDEELQRINTYLGELSATEQTIRENLARERVRNSHLLAALQRMAHDPPPAVVTQSADMLRAIRSGLLISGVVPTLQARTANMRKTLEELHAVRTQIDTQQDALAHRQSIAHTDRTRLTALLNHKRQEESERRAQALAEARRIAELARAARNLEEFLDKLAVPEGTITSGNFAQAKGRLALPVAGRVLRARDSSEPSSQILRPGLTIETPLSAQVITPYDGTVLYAGPFRQYGNILILGVGNAYHLLFAGLGTMTSFVGQEVLAGEPLGQMPESAQANAPTRLYMEIRHKGKTIDPGGWIIAKAR